MTTIFEHVRAHIPEKGIGLSNGGETLPDDAETDGMWAPGAHDGVLTHHWGGDADPDEVQRLTAALVEAAADGADEEERYQALYAVAQKTTVVSLVDKVLTGVRSSGVDPERCHRLAHRLATQGRHREPVKLGIALLGLFDARLHRDELMVLGRHDEFTLFAAVALKCRGDDDEPGAESDLWELGRKVHGWGRVHIVERLDGTSDPRIREWILREGFRNGVMDSYLAGIAAETGGLADALSDAPDDELLNAAGDILSALCEEGGPVAGMPAYADGERATALFLDHMSTRAGELRHFLAVEDVRAYAEREWPPLGARCAEIMDRPLWADLARRSLASPDKEEFHRASRVCGALGIPTLRARLDRLRTGDPLDSSAWFRAAGEAGPDGIDEVLALAVELLPLDEIATGPADEMGLGPGFRPHGCLDMLLQDLGKWPGRGVPLVLAGLASPVVRNRNLAVRVLHEWGLDAWPDGIEAAVNEAIDREPDDAVRERLRAVLDGRPVD
ncbi:hypothetical protein GCM10010191_29740 [Actinomadura vinacea]|uniref:Limonene hydroxylase n=1 Tax=Actinomadura vinacea TaxID=115336 RepID=A0ABN3IZR7_9ACTN